MVELVTRFPAFDSFEEVLRVLTDTLKLGDQVREVRFLAQILGETPGSGE
jgi:hypothetical protein